jgi:CHAD domain-containing protein
VRILLLADEGATQEAIATKAGVPIVQVRQMLRAYHRQGLGVFPLWLLSPSPFSPDTPIAEAGRQLMAALLLRVMSYIEDLETDTSVTAVHESRKTIRRLRTALRLFAPYYEAGLLKGYRRRFKKFMGRLSRSRDAAVFLIKLDDYLAQATEAGSLSPDEIEALAGLRAYWEDKLAAADAKERDYLDKDKFQKFLAEFESFVATEGEGVRASERIRASERVRLTTDSIKPSKTRHVAPLLIGDKLAAVRAYDDAIEDVAPETLHALRIAFKEFRYTLEFFEPVMGPTAGTANETVKQILTHLGDLNDARIHLEMLAKSNADELAPGLAPAVAHYSSVKMTELARLTAEFPALWSSFDRPEWRQDLYTAIAVL